jgi:hypothetical protein
MANAMTCAAAVLAGAARVAGAAGQEDLDGHPIAHGDPPPASSGSADRLDETHDLVTRDVRVGSANMARPLLIIGTAPSNRLLPISESRRSSSLRSPPLRLI